MSFWILFPVAGFVFIALRPRDPGPWMYGWAFLIVISVLLYEAVTMKAL